MDETETSPLYGVPASSDSFQSVGKWFCRNVVNVNKGDLYVYLKGKPPFSTHLCRPRLLFTEYEAKGSYLYRSLHN